MSWHGVLPQVLESQRGLDVRNFGLARLLKELTGWDASLFLSQGLVLAVVVALVARRRRSPKKETPSVALVALGCGVAILSLALVWFHYLVVAIPLLLLAARNAGLNSLFARIQGILALLLYLQLSTAFTPMPMSHAWVATLVNGLLLGLFVAALADLTRRRDGGVDPAR
jgi:uncharacterized membrane-anchored protein YitT (DUF2179 family)